MAVTQTCDCITSKTSFNPNEIPVCGCARTYNVGTAFGNCTI